MCGSDLHPYRSMDASEHGTRMGHEFLGIVEDTGREVRNLSRGDVVVASFAFQDNTCDVCRSNNDVLAMNQPARARYSPILADPRRPANTTRFVYLEPERAQEFFVDYKQTAEDAAAMLRLEAGRNPHDKALIELVGKLSTRSELFRQRWASQHVRFHRTGRKRLRHPIVGQLDLDFEAMEPPSEPGLHLNIYTAPAGTPTADALTLLASWAAGQEELPTEQTPTPADRR
ncbi:MmyB family transcriptional regulator [Nocardia fusca]